MPKKLGELLLDAGIISKEQLDTALAHQKETKKRIGEIIIEHKMASEIEIILTLSSQLGIPYIDLSKAVVDPRAVELIPEKLAIKYNLLPINVDGKCITVAMMDPLDFDGMKELLDSIDAVRFSTGYRIMPMITTRSELHDAISLYYDISQSVAEKLVKDLSQEAAMVEIIEEKEGVDVEILKRDSKTPPVIRMVNLIISDAVKSRASDVHIEPQEKTVLIRNRIDGLLRDIMELPKWIQGAMTSRIKIMALMDIAEKRQPQDGRVKLKVSGKEIDIRVSSLPTQYGEKVVMRLLDTKGAAVPLDRLGLSKDDMDKVISFTLKPQGVVIVTGPTGSGKTSTLYALLNRVRSEYVNIITLEDPIEFEIKGVNQVMIHEKAGLTFANGLRSILRQDPNIIMVGEMRDSETSEIALQASLTGHLVLSSLHTNDAPSTITRLLDLGIQPYLIASSLNGIIAQRLVRIICPYCKEKYTPSQEDLEVFKIKTIENSSFEFFRGKGCDHCKNIGYMGRIGVFEIFLVTARIREMIAARASEIEIRQEAISDGMKSLVDDTIKKIKMGITTIDELKRVIYFESEATSICTSCGKVISADFSVCPFCGHMVEAFCPHCKKHRFPEWIVCPYCSTKF